MDFSKVKLLLRIAELNKKGFQWVKIQQDTELIKGDEKDFTIQCDAVHASRLKWFGLIELKDKRTGLFRITPLGTDFLLGKQPVPSVIYCLGGEVVEQTPQMVFIDHIKTDVLDKSYWDNYRLFQKSYTSEQTEMIYE
jgi:hypothetical protein